jgi:hypothetical protein
MSPLEPQQPASRRAPSGRPPSKIRPYQLRDRCGVATPAPQHVLPTVTVQPAGFRLMDVPLPGTNALSEISFPYGALPARRFRAARLDGVFR